MKKKLSIIEKEHQFETNHKVYCTSPICKGQGHGVVFYNANIDRKLCVNCGYWIYRDDKTKLRYEMKERGILK